MGRDLSPRSGAQTVAPAAQACSKIGVVSVAPVFAEAISSIHSHDSVTRLFR